MSPEPERLEPKRRKKWVLIAEILGAVVLVLGLGALLMSTNQEREECRQKCVPYVGELGSAKQCYCDQTKKAPE